MKTAIPRMAHSRCFSKTVLSLVRVNLKMGKNQEYGNTFSIMDNYNHQEIMKMVRLLEVGSGFSKMESQEQQAASIVMKINTVNGEDIIRMVNCGTKVVSNTVKRKEFGKSMMRVESF